MAEAEGLVTHLTSLVLVDEEGEVQEGLPATRRIALPYPGGAFAEMSAACLGPPAPCAPAPSYGPRKAKRTASFRGAMLSVDSPRPASRSQFLRDMAIDWDVSPNQLLAGDLSALDPDDVTRIGMIAALPEIVAFAKNKSIEPIVLVIALIAHCQSSGNRSAERIARAVLGGRVTEEMRKLAALLGRV